MILSVSRITDIPAFFSEWFVRRLKDGVVYVRNPINRKMVSKIFLDPNIVEAIVFWTKNAYELTERLPEIEQLGYKKYGFIYTITEYSSDIEKNLPDKKRIIDNFILISKRIGREKMVWKYDPILVSDKYDLEFHKKSFKCLCEKLSSYCGSIVIDFIDIYRANKKYFREVKRVERLEIVKSLREIARENNVDIQFCCKEYSDVDFVKKAACVSSELVQNLTGVNVGSRKNKEQRKRCLCLESVDIGSYNTCRNGCTYCYASSGKDRKNYDPKSLVLCDEISADDTVEERVPKIVTDKQLAIVGC